MILDVIVELLREEAEFNSGGRRSQELTEAADRLAALAVTMPVGRHGWTFEYANECCEFVERLRDSTDLRKTA